jgi:hypothetical protein
MMGTSPWPDRLDDLGSRRVGPYTACAVCATGTWVRYGPVMLCLTCARSVIAVRALPDPEDVA